MRSKIIQRYFSLVEVLMAMAVLSILILASFQFFSTAQNTWTITDAKRTTFEDARIALDLISRDIESAYYGDGTVPFWHWKPAARPSSWGEFRNELLAFIADTPIPPNSECTSTLCEVKYQLYYATNHADGSEGWIKRSVTGNISDGAENPRWNFFNNFIVGYTTADNPVSSLTANSKSSDDYQKLIPYVIDLSFTCDTDTDTGTVIDPDTTTSASADSYDVRIEQPFFPAVITVSLTIMDKDSWQKWISLQGSSVYPGSETAAAQAYRVNHQVTFSKMIYLGDRGQE